jgi:hypothetical protein
VQTPEPWVNSLNELKNTPVATFPATGAAGRNPIPGLLSNVATQHWMTPRLRNERPLARMEVPPSWDLEDNGACFILRDANGKAAGSRER